MKYLSISDATVLGFLSPIGAGIAAALVLKEKYSIKEAVAACRRTSLYDSPSLLMKVSLGKSAV